MWWGMMEGGGAMERRGSDVGYWREETHLGSLFPMSTHCFPCLHVGAHVRASVPASVRRCPRPRVGARVRASLPLSPRRCPCPHVVAHVHVLLPVSVYVRGWSFSFVGMGGSLCWWAVVFVHGQRQCGVGEPLVGGGESSGLALTCGGVAVVVASWYQAVRVAVVASGASRSCRVVVWLPRRQLRCGTFGCCQ